MESFYDVLNDTGYILCIENSGWRLSFAGNNSRYVARFSTRAGYLHIRIPWTAFRSESASLGKAEPASQVSLDPGSISYIGLR